MYYNQFDVYGYIHQLNQYLQQQQSEIKRLQETLTVLQSEIKELKTKPTTNIEKIEYKFDQLKVETLEGTLNIGLNPYNTEQVEEFAVKQGAINGPKGNQPPQQIREIVRSDIMEYLDKEAVTKIQEIEQRLGKKPNEPYYEFMIQDVKKQLDSRINYYLENVGPDDLRNEDSSNEAVNQVIQKMKFDIENAFFAFIQHLPKG